jgi:hypothetical protein
MKGGVSWRVEQEMKQSKAIAGLFMPHWQSQSTLAESMTSDDDARPAALLAVNTDHTMHHHHDYNAFKLHPRCKY